MERDIQYALLVKQVNERYKIIMKKREQIVEAFIAETGLKPSECEMVEKRCLDNRIVWYIRKRKQ